LKTKIAKYENDNIISNTDNENKSFNEILKKDTKRGEN